MRPAALLEPAHQDFVPGVEEQDTERHAAGTQGTQGGLDVREEVLAPDINDDGQFGDRFGGMGNDLGERAQHLRGRLSTTYQPWSSSASDAVLRPAPDMPVTTSSSASGGLTGSSRPAPRPILPLPRPSVVPVSLKVVCPTKRLFKVGICAGGIANAATGQVLTLTKIPGFRRWSC